MSRSIRNCVLTERTPDIECREYNIPRLVATSNTSVTIAFERGASTKMAYTPRRRDRVLSTPKYQKLNYCYLHRTNTRRRKFVIAFSLFVETYLKTRYDYYEQFASTPTRPHSQLEHSPVIRLQLMNTFVSSSLYLYSPSQIE